MLRMSFMEHLEELRTRIIRSLLGLAVIFILCILFANKLWEIGRDTMHARVAADATKNEELRQLLADPKFREAFAGEGDTESANAELFKTIGDTVVEQLSQSKKLLGRYAKMTAPGVRAGEFVVDLVYDDYKNWLSAQAVDQASGVAGDFARATRALQKRYQASVDALQECKAGE